MSFPAVRAAVQAGREAIVERLLAAGTDAAARTSMGAPRAVGSAARPRRACAALYSSTVYCNMQRGDFFKFL